VTYQVGRAALADLYGSYWSAGGWRDVVAPPSEAAVDAGVMFDAPWTAGHDQIVEAARTAASRLDPAEVGEAFVASLTSRRLDLRSALGSFAVARHLPAHPFHPGTDGDRCGTCGLTGPPQPIDRNVLNFERFKWGGVRSADPAYLAFDLMQFVRAPRLRATAGDRELGRALLGTLRELPGARTATRAVPALRALPGNADERAVVLDILGVCGILETPGHPGFATGFVAYRDRAESYTERAYPVCWWRASDGVSAQHLKTFLPQLM
jgi:hypothetical protein